MGSMASPHPPVNTPPQAAVLLVAYGTGPMKDGLRFGGQQGMLHAQQIFAAATAQLCEHGSPVRRRHRM